MGLKGHPAVGHSHPARRSLGAVVGSRPVCYQLGGWSTLLHRPQQREDAMSSTHLPSQLQESLSNKHRALGGRFLPALLRRKWASGSGWSRAGLDGIACSAGHGHRGSAHTAVPESDDEGASRLPTLCRLCSCPEGQAGKAPGQAGIDHPLPAQGTAAQGPQEGGGGVAWVGGKGCGSDWWGGRSEWLPHPWEGNSCWRSWTGLPTRPRPGIQLAVSG